MSQDFFSPPTRKNPPAVASLSQIFIPPHQRFVLPHPTLSKTIFILEPHKDFIFSCSHCSCSIFIWNLFSLYIQVMLILILIDVQYLQNLVCSFEKGSNVQNHSLSESHSSMKKFSQQNFLFPYWEDFSAYPSTLFGKYWCWGIYTFLQNLKIPC